MSQSDFSRKKIRQSEYRPLGSKVSDEKVRLSYLATKLPKLNLESDKKQSFKKKIRDELKKILSKLLPEELHPIILKSDCVKTIFNVLGLS